MLKPSRRLITELQSLEQSRTILQCAHQQTPPRPCPRTLQTKTDLIMGKRRGDLKQVIAARIAIDDSTGCWNWTGSKGRRGYGWIWDGSRNCRAHRLSYKLHCGPIADGMQVCHRCDNPPCVNPAHLFLASDAENKADKMAKGRQARGSGNGQAKLTEAQIMEIIAMPGTNVEIARKYGVGDSHISHIRSGRKWAHITNPGSES
jgi:HNH endonuclease